MEFTGFPRQVRYIPVPSPVFGLLLEQIDSLAELKCLLRVIWLLHQKRGYPRFISLRELLADRTMSKALPAAGPAAGAQLRLALGQAVGRGTLVTAAIDLAGEREQVYALNSPPDRDALARLVAASGVTVVSQEAEPWQEIVEPPNVFALYEDNVGMISPMIAEELREAQQLYPAAWIEEAFREAVSRNKRSWRYIASILERWGREGRTDGEPGRYSKKASYY